MEVLRSYKSSEEDSDLSRTFDSEMKAALNLVRTKRFAQFKAVKLGEVWNELKSSKVVSYTVVRDVTVFLFVQVMWLSLHLLLWKGSVLESQRTGEVSLGTNTGDTVRIDRIEAFFMDPKTVSRNLMVCSGFPQVSKRQACQSWRSWSCK